MSARRIPVSGIALALALASGCGATTRGAETVRPVGEDALALLPSGADLVADVDVEQLRAWPEARRFVQLLPEAARARLLRLGFDPLGDVDQILVAVAQLATPAVAATLVVRGGLEADKLTDTLGRPADVSATTYHDAALWEGPGGALGQLAKRLWVLGSPVDVRRAIDLARGDGESLRSSSGDGRLRAALERAPTAKLGHPAVRVALVFTEAFRAQLHDEQLPGAELEWLAASLAVGEGFDVGGLVGTAGPREAERITADGQARVKEFARRPTVRALGLAPYVEPIVLKARDAEVHFAYWMGQATVERMLDRLESLDAQARAQKNEQPKGEPDR